MHFKVEEDFEEDLEEDLENMNNGWTEFGKYQVYIVSGKVEIWIQSSGSSGMEILGGRLY